MIRCHLLLTSDTYICTSWPPDNYCMVCKCNTLWWCFARARVPIQIYLQDALQISADGFMQWNVRYTFIVECFEYLPFRVWENGAEAKTLHHSNNMAQNYLFRRVFVQRRTRRSGWSKAGSDPGSVPCRRPSEPCPSSQTCLQQPIKALFSYAPNLQGWIALLHMLGRLVIIIAFYVTMSTLYCSG